MSGTRFYNPAPVFLDLLGLAPLAGGSLTFYDRGTTTAKGTWSDAALTVANPNPVPLDSSGRPNVNIWLSGAYTVLLKAADGTSVWTRDVDSGAGSGATIPALLTGKFLTNDGSNMIWSDVLQVPDPTGAAGKVLSTDGSNLIWQSVASIALPAATSSSIKINDILDQWGSASIPASGTRVATALITFPTAYIEVPNVSIMIARGSGVVPAGYIGTIGYQASASNFTVAWDLGVNATGSSYNLTTAIPITWRAIGKVAS